MYNFITFPPNTMTAKVEVDVTDDAAEIVKKWHDNKTTYFSGIATTIVSLAAVFGYSLNDNLPIELARFGDNITYIIMGVLGLLAMWGRAKALGPGFIGKKRLSTASHS